MQHLMAGLTPGMPLPSTPSSAAQPRTRRHGSQPQQQHPRWRDNPLPTAAARRPAQTNPKKSPDTAQPRNSLVPTTTRSIRQPSVNEDEDGFMLDSDDEDGFGPGVLQSWGSYGPSYGPSIRAPRSGGVVLAAQPTPLLTKATDKNHLKPELRAELARRLRREAPDFDAAPGQMHVLRVYRFALDDLRLYKAVHEAGMEGRVVVVDDPGRAHVVLATQHTRTGRDVAMTNAKNLALNLNIPFIALERVSGLRLMSALAPIMGIPVPPHLSQRKAPLQPLLREAEEVTAHVTQLALQLQQPAQQLQQLALQLQQPAQQPQAGQGQGQLQQRLPPQPQLTIGSLLQARHQQQHQRHQQHQQLDGYHPPHQQQQQQQQHDYQQQRHNQHDHQQQQNQQLVAPGLSRQSSPTADQWHDQGNQGPGWDPHHPSGHPPPLQGAPLQQAHRVPLEQPPGWAAPRQGTDTLIAATSEDATGRWQGSVAMGVGEAEGMEEGHVEDVTGRWQGGVAMGVGEAEGMGEGHVEDVTGRWQGGVAMGVGEAEGMGEGGYVEDVTGRWQGSVAMGVGEAEGMEEGHVEDVTGRWQGSVAMGVGEAEGMEEGHVEDVTGRWQGGVAMGVGEAEGMGEGGYVEDVTGRWQGSVAMGVGEAEGMGEGDVEDDRARLLPTNPTARLGARHKIIRPIKHGRRRSTVRDLRHAAQEHTPW